MNPPLVTTALTCWNHERFVAEAIHSAVRQTYPNIQLIVFDNDSSDGSRKVIEELRSQYDFEFIHQENVGLVRTLNRALKMAKGRYFACLSCDDIWLPDKTERQVAFLENNPEIDMVIGYVSCVDKDGKDISFPLPNRPGEATFQRLMRGESGVYGPTYMFRTSTALALGGYDEDLRIDDNPLALRFTYHGRRVFDTGEIYAKYRRHDNQWTNQGIYRDTLQTGHKYRQSPEYPNYIRYKMKGYFRSLAGEQKLEAIRLLMNEPIVWSWDDVGVGFLKLLIPGWLLRRFRKWKRHQA